MRCVPPSKYLLLGLAAGVASLSLAAIAAESLTVRQEGRTFSVRVLQVARGDVVHFFNADPFAHNLYIESETFRFDSGLQTAGTVADVTFSHAGGFEVLCAIHPRMELHVDVQ